MHFIDDLELIDFENLLSATVDVLNAIADEYPEQVSRLAGSNLEPFVVDEMNKLAAGSTFEGQIELIGGQKFPDIVIKGRYGVEVKTTTKNHWKTTGNSVMESSRIQGVEHIYMLFAKLAKPIEFRYRLYEEVLSEIVVTHSPRYQIDMDLVAGQTIFDKIDIPYGELREKKDPIKPIVTYYKGRLKPGEELWWMNSDETNLSSDIVLRALNTLPPSERAELTNIGMVYFPEIFSNNKDKFNRYVFWLLKEKSVVSHNIRDFFTSGGTRSFSSENYSYPQVPQILFRLFNNVENITRFIVNTPAEELTYYWDQDTTETSKLTDWMNLVSDSFKKDEAGEEINVKGVLTDLLK